MHLPSRPDVPIACDMSTADDTPDERLAEYGRLFARALVRRARRDDGVVLTFARDERAAVEDLVRRESACCPFLDYRVELIGDRVVWTTTNPRSGDDRAHADMILDALYALPDHIGSGLAG
jgi:hypothetical protein